MQTPVRIVCFDLGGVIIRICRSWAEACAAAGVEDRADVDSIWASGDERLIAINDDYQCGRMAPQAFAERCAALVGGAYTPQEILQVHASWTQREYAGVKPLIERIHAAGFETAVLSNTCEDHWELLHREPAFQALRNRHASHLLGLRKPDPAIYAALEAQVKCHGASIVFFDDLIENVKAARAHGWRAEQVDHTGDTAAQMGTVLVEMGVLKKPSV